MQILLLLPLLGVCAGSYLTTVLLPNSWANHPQYDENIRAIQNSQQRIDDIKAQLGLNVPDSSIEFPNEDLQKQLLEGLQTLRINIDTLKTQLQIPRGPSNQLIQAERTRLSENGVPENQIDMFALYQVSLEDLTEIQSMLQTVNTVTSSMQNNQMDSIKQTFDDMENENHMRMIMSNIIFPTSDENNFESYVKLIEAGHCRLKRIGYEILFDRINGPTMAPLTKKIVKLLLNLRKVIRDCDIPNHVIETYRAHIPRSLQILILNDVSTVCIKNTKYNEELITDKYGLGDERYVFTWTPKDRRDVSKWEVEYDSDMKMRFKNKVYNRYLNLRDNYWNNRAFLGPDSSHNWEIELSTESMDNLALRHAGTGKYIYVTASVFCPLRRHVVSSVMKHESAEGGVWEFIDCEDAPLGPEAV